MSTLFSPITVRDLVIRNRLWVSPMCQYSAIDGVVQEWHHTHLTQFASGGAGLVITEASAVVPEGRISPADAGLWNDRQRDAWASIVAGIHSRGAAAGIQLAHAGRKASTASPLHGARGSVDLADGGWVTQAPSAIAYQGFAEPAELRTEQIDALVAAFAAAATRAVDAGFDLVEVHAAHGYLLHEFLSPLSNQRSDEYGGSLENRARFLLRVLHAIRDVCPTLPIFVRFSASDGADGGWSVEDTVTVSGWVAAAGADLIDVSAGGLVAHQKIEVFPGYQVGYANRVRSAVDIPVAAVGLITDAEQAERILTEGSADAILAGREWLRDPHFALRAATELDVDIDYWPAPYLRARRSRHAT